MTQTLNAIFCPKCQKECTVMHPKKGKICGKCDKKINFHITPEAALIEMLQKAFWPKD